MGTEGSYFMRMAGSLAAIWLIWGTVSAQETHPHRVTRVTGEKAANPSEVSVGVNPTDPDHIVAVSLQHRHPDDTPGITNYAYVSRDGGSSWYTYGHPNPQRRTQGDDVITFGRDGMSYHTYISFQGLRQQRPDDARNGIFVTHSADGREWSDPVPVVDHINTVAPFEDKPWMTTDRTDSDYAGNLYLAWTRFDVYGSSDPADSTQIYFSRSYDGGQSFAMPFVISDHGGDAVDSSNTVEGAVPAVGPSGEVYVAWSGPLGIMFDRSLDGGWTFGEDIHVADNPGGWDLEIRGLGRANGMPVTAVNLHDDTRHGRIYINWIDRRYGDPDVFIAYSDNRGDDWSEPIRVNDDPVGNQKEQFFTWMAVDPTDGSVNIAFYDRRNFSGTLTGLILARSTDGGKTFSNYRIDQEPFETNSGVFFGDYLGIDAYGGRVVVAYTHFTSPDSLAVSSATFHFN